VVLVSNQPDIPFDLSHIRDIRLRRHRAFWDHACLKHPEEAIFNKRSVTAVDTGAGMWRMDYFPFKKRLRRTRPAGNGIQRNDARAGPGTRRRAEGRYASGPRAVVGLPSLQSLPSRWRQVVWFSLKLDATSEVPPDEPIPGLDVFDRAGETITLPGTLLLHANYVSTTYGLWHHDCLCSGRKESHDAWNSADRHSYPGFARIASDMGLQSGLGLLSQRGTWTGFADPRYSSVNGPNIAYSQAFRLRELSSLQSGGGSANKPHSTCFKYAAPP
jgi:hypothetical protein